MLLSMLSEFNKSSETILASSLLSRDGLVLASVLPTTPPTLNEDTVGALTSAVAALSDATLNMVGDNLDRVLVTGKDCSLLMTPVGPEMILAVIFAPDESAGAIFSHMRLLAGHIEAHATPC